MLNDSTSKCFLGQYQINSLKTIDLEAKYWFPFTDWGKKNHIGWKVQITAEKKRNQYCRLYIPPDVFHGLPWLKGQQWTITYISSLTFETILTDWKDQIKLHCDSDMDQFKDKQVYLSEPRTKRCFYGHIRVGMRSTRWKNMSWSKHVNRLFKQAFMKSNENLHLVVVLRGCLFTMRDIFFLHKCILAV